jgi:hypothetical protein
MQEHEKTLLRALCQGVLQGDRRERACRLLVGHHFTAPEHGVLFAALSTMRASNLNAIREQLPARLVNLGFPDFDLTPYLEGPPPTIAEIVEAMRRIEADVRSRTARP